MKNQSNKKKQNQSLIPFLSPASKRSNSTLQGVREFVEEFNFLTNWDSIDHDGWTLPATKEKHYWCGIWKTLGCCNEQAHQRLGKGNKYYIKKIQFV